VNGARVLATAGTISYICAMLSGFLDSPIILGIGGCVMLFGNIFVALDGAK
jgi:hypothetical protein